MSQCGAKTNRSRTGASQGGAIPASAAHQCREASAACTDRVREQAPGARPGEEHGNILGVGRVRLLRQDDLRTSGSHAGMRGTDAGNN